METNSTFYTGVNSAVKYIRPEEKDELKPGIRLDPELGFLIPGARPSDSDPRLVTIRQDAPLREGVEEVCRQWQLSDADAFAFLIGADCASARGRSLHFLTQDNRRCFAPGPILLLLSASPLKTAQALCDALDADEVSRLAHALRLVVARASDPTFAHHLLRQDALARILTMVHGQTCLGQNHVPTLLLDALVALMESPPEEGEEKSRWTGLEEATLQEVSSMVTGKSKTESPELICSALNVLELCLVNSPSHYPQIRDLVPFAALIRHLDHSSQEIQRNALALMNALYRRAEEPLLGQISAQVRSNPVRNAIRNNILHARGPGALPSELSHQLGVLQRLFLHLHYHGTRASRPISTASGSADLEELNALRSSVFVHSGLVSGSALSPTSTRKFNAAQLGQQFAALGFPTPHDPASDLAATPPGLLPLDCIRVFFAECPDEAKRMVLDVSATLEPPTAAASPARAPPPLALLAIHLSTLIADILQIHQLPLETGQPMLELLFETESPLERLFCVGMAALRRDWREMSAGPQDVDKVLKVVRVQLERSLAKQPKSLADLAEELKRVPYAEVKRVWDEERAAGEDRQSSKQPIRELREALRPEMVALVGENRLRKLEAGACFPSYSAGERSTREKGRWVQVALEAGRAALVLRQTEREEPPPAKLEGTRLALSDVHDVLLGRDCPHVKETKRRTALDPAFAFSLLVASPDQCLNFLAPDAAAAQVWVDGLRAALGREPASQLAQDDLKLLLDTEIRIRLLALHGALVPNETPNVPTPPSDLNFVMA